MWQGLKFSPWNQTGETEFGFGPLRFWAYGIWLSLYMFFFVHKFQDLQSKRHSELQVLHGVLKASTM